MTCCDCPGLRNLFPEFPFSQPSRRKSLWSSLLWAALASAASLLPVMFSSQLSRCQLVCFHLSRGFRCFHQSRYLLMNHLAPYLKLGVRVHFLRLPPCDDTVRHMGLQTHVVNTSGAFYIRPKLFPLFVWITNLRPVERMWHWQRGKQNCESSWNF